MSATRRELESFRELAGRLLGLDFDESRWGQLEEALCRRAGEAGFADPAAYLAAARVRPAAEEARELAALLTVGETYFFRNSEQFEALSSVLRARSTGGPVRILSAGCASGEEAFTLAMVGREAGVAVEVFAVDVNAVALRKAAKGVFSPWSLRDTKSDMRARYFRASGPDFVLDDGIRRSVRFEESNLAADDPKVWRPGAWDVVFCRNVIMYFRPAVAHEIVARIARSLAPGGLLFLGHAETLRGISHDFHLEQSHGAFYYRRLDRPGATPEPRAEERFAAAEVDAAAALVEGASTWMEAIRAATERIGDLAARAPAARPEGERPRSAVLDLMARERFGEALAAMGPEGGEDADARLLRGAILANAGNTGEAERLCRSVLAADDMNSGAHYLMALCREAARDPEAAAEHDRAAAHLDASFAMPRLHLGFLLRKLGDLPAARGEFERALALLPGEDASRILLFGGGFGRAVLVDLCRAEIRACEGRPA